MASVISATIFVAACSATSAEDLASSPAARIATVEEPGLQLGIDIDFYASPGLPVAAPAQQPTALKFSVKRPILGDSTL
jgi:hypothetical protein